MKKKTKKEIRKDFEYSRTSWRFFDRIFESKSSAEQLLLEILKELQYLNDK